MKVIQIMPTVSFGDAVSNDARALNAVISGMGYKTGIYAENIDPRIFDSFVHHISKMPQLNDNDVLIFNHSTGTELCYKIQKMRGRKFMIYHNITPPFFFEEYSKSAKELTEYGYEGTKALADSIEAVLADSKFNAEDLVRMGYKCDISVRPILIPFSDYEKKPNARLINEYSDDGYTNIIFVGRLAPNKKQEDIIAAFSFYKKFINPKSRLVLVGSDTGMENYSARLKRYVKALMLDDVIFTGHISFDSILAWYRLADAFVCMSEHEGFCVPLVEAMYFKVPIIAFNSSAIGDTLGGSGLLLNKKDPVETAMLIDKIVTDRNMREEVISGQNERLKDFSYDKVKNIFTEQLNRYINGNK